MTDDLLTLYHDLQHTLGGVFRCMDIAEEAIFDFQIQYPEKADLLDDCFLTVTPTCSAIQKQPHMFRHHARELLQRVVDGEKLQPATRAEAILILSEASLKAPLQRDAGALYIRLFKEIFPNYREIIGQTVIHESYPGATDQILAEIQRRAYQQRHIPQVQPEAKQMELF